MCANTSFFGWVCAKAGARPVARMPAMPALACNRPRRVIAVLVFPMVMRFLRVSTFAPGYCFLPVRDRLPFLAEHTS